MADHGSGEVDHAPGHPAMGEEIARQDEEGNGHDLEFLNTREELERHRLQRHLSHGKKKGQYGQTKGNGNGHARDHQGKQYAEDDDRVHGCFSLFTAGSSASLCMSCGWRLSSSSGKTGAPGSSSLITPSTWP